MLFLYNCLIVGMLNGSQHGKYAPPTVVPDWPAVERAGL